MGHAPMVCICVIYHIYLFISTTLHVFAIWSGTLHFLFTLLFYLHLLAQLRMVQGSKLLYYVAIALHIFSQD